MLYLTRIDRQYVHIDVTAALADGTPADLGGVDVALLGRGGTPAADTEWTAAAYSGGTAVVLVAGPDADPDGGQQVPVTGADLWIRVVDSPEVQAVLVDAIRIKT